MNHMKVKHFSGFVFELIVYRVRNWKVAHNEFLASVEVVNFRSNSKAKDKKFHFKGKVLIDLNPNDNNHPVKQNFSIHFSL